MTDVNIPKKIVRLAELDKSCNVLEIGPGFGILTKELAKTCASVTAVEIDKYLAEQLKGITDIYPNVSVIEGDILKTDLSVIVNKQPEDDSFHVCANLPYNITTPVLTKCMESRLFRSITVMVQKEVAMRMCARPSTPDYGAFSVFTGYYAVPEILFDVPPECFSPRPKITSSVVRLLSYTETELESDDEKLFFRIVRAAFGQRRKMLVNALFAVFHDTHSKQDIIGMAEKAGFDTNIRGEALGVDDFIELAMMFKKLQ